MRRLVLVDTSVLLNLAIVDRLDLLAAFPDLRFAAPREVLAEVIRPQQRALVEMALQESVFEEFALGDTEALSIYAELLQIMGSGESACLALAIQHRAWIASDEKRVFLREANRRLGPGCILNTPGLLLLGLYRSALSLEEADSIKAVLERHRFKMSFGSFAEISRARTE